MKTCTKCGEMKGFGEFYRRADTCDGLQPHCSTCDSAKSKNHYWKNKEYHSKRSKIWREANRGYRKEQAAKYNEENKEYLKECSRKRYRKNLVQNRERNNKYHRKYYQRNKRRIKKRNKEYRALNPERHRIIKQRRRARKRQLPATLTEDQWQETLEACNHKCVYCGAPWKDGEHFVPESKGGGYTVNNILPACKRCNLTKSDKDPFDFIKNRLPVLSVG